MVKKSVCNAGDLGSIPGKIREEDQEDALEKKMATHCSILTWSIILWTEDPGGYSPQGGKESDMTE